MLFPLIIVPLDEVFIFANSPFPDIHTQEGEGPVQWWGQLFGDVVSSIEPEGWVFHHLQRSPHQLDQRLAGGSVDNDVGDPLSTPGL